VEKNIVERGRPQITIWCMRIAYWIPKATNTLSEYVILVAFHCKYSCTNTPQLPALLKAILITSFQLSRNLPLIFPSGFLTSIKFHFLISSMRVFVWSKLTSFYHPYNSLRGAENMNTRIIQFYPASSYFHSFRSTYSPNYPVLEHLCFILNLSIEPLKHNVCYLLAYRLFQN